MNSIRIFGGLCALMMIGKHATAADMDGIVEAGGSPYLILVVLMAAIGIVLLLWSVLVRDRGGVHDAITDYPAKKDIHPANRDMLDTPVP